MVFDVIPSGWRATTLGGICQEGGGDIQTGPFGSKLHASDYVDAGIPSIMPANIKDGRISEEGIARIRPSDAERLSRYLVREGDIVYSRRGDVERCALVRHHQAGWLCGTGCLRVRTGSGVIESNFCAHFLSHPDTREWISRHAIGATMPNLNTQILSAVPVLLPPSTEQKAIAHILGTLDDKIELNRKTNETLEAMARALFQSWFVDFDPVRAKAAGRPTGLPEEISELFPDSFAEAELGEIPRGWDVGCLSDCCEITMGQSPPGDTYNEEGVGLPFYQGKTDFGFRFPGRRIYCTSSTRQASEGATLISVRAPVGSANVAKELCAIGRGIAALKSRQDAKSFVYYLIGTLQNIFESYNSEGTVFGAINGKNLASIMVTVPEVKVISAFNAKCSSVDEMIKKNTEEAEVLASIRDTLLPKLISGELRIPEAEKLLEQAGV